MASADNIFNLLYTLAFYRILCICRAARCVGLEQSRFLRLYQQCDSFSSLAQKGIIVESSNNKRLGSVRIAA